MIGEMARRLVDSYGRIADDLRISVTDRCNLRCVYCMPAHVTGWLSREEILSFEEIVRVARVLVERYGTRTIRLTGGEPLVRSGITELIGMLDELTPDLDLSLTTNGIKLASLAPALKAAGLRRVNVSLDTLHADRFQAITRRGAFDQVMEGLAAAEAAGLAPIKLNVVVMRGQNDDEVVDFARFARARGCDVRFIEFMPLDGDGTWRPELVVPSRRIQETIEDEFPLVAETSPRPAPANRFAFADGAPGSIGFISSVSDAFCSSCNRLRLSAEGGLRTCLFSLRETPLRPLLRAGASDAEIGMVIERAVWLKEEGGALAIGSSDYVKPAKNMSQIGG